MDNNKNQFLNSWAIILGGSSGFGFATVEKLASHGMNIAILYREFSMLEKPLLENLNTIATGNGVKILPFNINALNASGINSFIEQFIALTNKKHCVRLLLHSIARGNLKPLVAQQNTPHQGEEVLSVDDIQLTAYAMSTSLLDWVRAILDAGLFEPDARVIGLTSEGAHRYWEGYAAVSLAKAALESLTMYMAVEFARFGLKTNLIQAGITDTPSFKKIDGSKKLIKIAEERNPLGRITKPADVANVIYLLCTSEAAWINGSIIHVDGGEHCR